MILDNTILDNTILEEELKKIKNPRDKLCAIPNLIMCSLFSVVGMVPAVARMVHMVFMTFF